ncbi:outer envelope pore protein 16-1, chloroplastic-like [Miscanthus floridulus]|uniref:outer envelope pore protein 16-1, chloroplastic-like n=1 Tax=Miscanthus floridulus TaxID=154761 RepID=UPI00345A012E
MSKSNRARFGPAAKWEGNRAEVTKKMDWSPVSSSGHYDISYVVSPDGKSWHWSWRRQTFYEDTSTKPSVVPRDLPAKPLDVAIRALRSVVVVGAVAACKVAAEDTVDCLGKEGVSRHKLGRSLKKICKEGAYWGAAAGAFETLEFGAELMRGCSDWKNAMIGGALAGATISAATSYNSHGCNVYTRQVIKAAITGGAIGTAFEFINHRRHVDRFDQPHPLRTDDATDQTLELTDEPNPRSHVVINNEM